ncbi:MAG TPA: NAD-dependent epimerase/dehydratase family protein, partial [Candidatus Desulfofervidus auxilii]|nr:NAD-dependent epimerase/dehydratase family protein [Candidatus Desulfofervidus auxilii]
IPGPQKEDMDGYPCNIYGFSKWIADCIAREYMKITDSLIVGLRYFNVFGPKEDYKGKMASMVWQLAQQIKAGLRPRIFKWGEQKRDQVYVKDVVRANLLALKAKKSCIVNIGSGKAISFNKIVKVLNEVLGKNLEPEYIDNPYVGYYQEYTQADLTLAKEILGYTPQWTFEDAVRDYMKTVGFI